MSECKNKDIHFFALLDYAGKLTICDCPLCITARQELEEFKQLFRDGSLDINEKIEKGVEILLKKFGGKKE